MKRQWVEESGISTSHEVCLMEPQRVIISFTSMPQPEQIPALLLGEPVVRVQSTLQSTSSTVSLQN